GIDGRARVTGFIARRGPLGAGPRGEGGQARTIPDPPEGNASCLMRGVVAPGDAAMKLRKIAVGLLVVLVASGTAGWFSLDKETRGLLATMPTNRDILFWSQPQRDAAFRALDRLPVLARARVVPAGGTPTPLPPGPPLKLALDVDAYMAGQRSAA